MHRGAAVVEGGGDHLEWFRANAFDTIVNEQPEGKELILLYFILQLFDAFGGKGVGSHEQVNGAGLFDQVHDEPDQVVVSKAVIVGGGNWRNESDGFGENKICISNQSGMVIRPGNERNWSRFSSFPGSGWLCRKGGGKRSFGGKKHGE